MAHINVIGKKIRPIREKILEKSRNCDKIYDMYLEKVPRSKPGRTNIQKTGGQIK